MDHDRDEIENALNEAVHVVPYDAAWPAIFEAERRRLLDRFADRIIEIRHFGSTAVPGLAAKPIVDLIAGVSSAAQIPALIDELTAFGYHYSAAGNAGFVDHRWLFRQAGGHRTHHLHVVEHGAAAWRDRLRFCEALQHDATLRERYEKLKRELASRFGAERERYTAAKTEFIRDVIRSPESGPPAGSAGAASGG